MTGRPRSSYGEFMSEKTFAIIGGGVTGGRAAETLREGFDGNILLICGEPDRPYERPPLSKEYLRGEKPADEVFLRPAAFYDEHRIELILGERAQRVDVASKKIVLENGRTIAYDKALVATGATPNRLNVPGSNLKGVTTLRTIRDAAALEEQFSKKPRVVVIGSGFIGCEVAASARTLGCEVTMIGQSLPLVRALGNRFGEYYRDVHAGHGVTVRTGVGIAEFRGSTSVETAVTTSGEHLACDLAVIGIGVAPDLAFLTGEPIKVENGIVTDEFCRTSAPDVFAAGDVANWWNPLFERRMRVEHFDNAKRQGVAAAKNMLGESDPYAPVPYFWSDQYDIHLHYVGYRTESDREVVRGNPGAGPFSVFYVNESGHVSACAAVNKFKDISAARKLIHAHAQVKPEDLANESVDLSRVATP